ncbi:MAG: glycosyltransferase [Candidatus Omnitrophica bacterium]|nr:glycosyltransferase [Candidatus Omnitrophota bacterium]
MKIFFATLHDPKFPMGGAEKVLLEMALALRFQKKHEVEVAVNPGDLSRELESSHIPVIFLQRSKLRSFETLKSLRQAIDRFQPDVLHSHHRYLTFLASFFLKSRVKILHTEHVWRSDKMLLFQSGHFVTAVSQGVGENLIKNYKLPRSRVRVIPNAVSVSPPHWDHVNQLKEKFRKSEENSCLALFVGRLEIQKGLIYLLEALTALSPEDQKKIRVLVAGDGSLNRELKKKAESLGLSGRVFFLGHVRPIADYIALCDFLILPSLWEGMPLVILEGAAVGLPAIATDIPGTRETILPGKTGLLVPAKDVPHLSSALAHWLNQPQEIKEMGLAAKKFVQEQFSFAGMLNRYEEVYRAL